MEVGLAGNGGASFPLRNAAGFAETTGGLAGFLFLANPARSGAR
jgi:hypothetical protein